MRKPDFPAVVHTYTDVLRLLREQPHGDAAHLAGLTGRVASNVRRDMHKLIDAGVIEHDGACWSLTDKGRQWVAGQDVAEGLASADDAIDRWPIDKCVPNPANRTVNPASIPDMADQIEGAGDILQRLTLTPVRADGTRMILIGERRWRGASLLRHEGRLPAALAEGLPFDEREATEGEAALIAVIENSGREDMTPWDDALMLARAAKGLGITNGSELARRAGRVREGSRGGTRDVQDKLRLVREATPEQIAAYQANGSWDDFRDKVFKRGAYALSPKPQTMSDLVAEYGAAALKPSEPTPLEQAIETAVAPEAEDYASTYKRRIRTAIDSLKAKQFLALVEVADHVSRHALSDGYAPCRVSQPDPTKAADHLVAHAGLGFRYYAGQDSVRLGAETIDYLREKGLFQPDGRGVVDYRLGLLRQEALGISAEAELRQSGRYWTAWLNTESATVQPQQDDHPHTDGRPLYVTDTPWKPIENLRMNTGAGAWVELLLYQCGDDTLFHATVKSASGSESAQCDQPAATREAAIAEAAKRAQVIVRPTRDAALMAWLDAWIGPHVVNGVDYGNATRAQEARYAAGILQRPAANYGSSSRSETPAPAAEPSAETSLPATTIEMRPASARQELAEQRLERLGAALQVLTERLEPLLAVLGGDRTEDGLITLETDDADYYEREISEACQWAEDALADTSSVFDGWGDETPRPSLSEPAVPIRKSIMPDFIVCLEDGRKFKSLKRHLRTRYNLSPEAYRQRWGLPADYPMVAPNYAKAREDLARQMGLSRAEAR